MNLSLNSKVLAGPHLSFLYKLGVMLYQPHNAGVRLKQDNITKAPEMPVGFPKAMAFLLSPQPHQQLETSARSEAHDVLKHY